jgi:hypothetical protein
MIFKILVTMDGNNSLKCILCCQPLATPADGEPEPKGPQVGESRELPNQRKVGRDYLLSRENVNQWMRAVLEDMLPILEAVSSAMVATSMKQLLTSLE